jgi:hypothetical protein
LNRRGHPETLVPSQPGNENALKSGVHSPRFIAARAAEYEADLTSRGEFSPAQLIVVREVARCMALLEAIDADLDSRGLVDRRGKPRYLLDHRARISRQLERWLEKLMEITDAAAPRIDLPVANQGEIAMELQRIGFRIDPRIKPAQQLAALRALMAYGLFERPAVDRPIDPEEEEIQERERAVRLRERNAAVDMREKMAEMQEFRPGASNLGVSDESGRVPEEPLDGQFRRVVPRTTAP